MNTAPARPAVTGRRCAGRPAVLLETVSVSRHDNSLIADRRTAELRDDAHTHADRDGDMHVVRPIGAVS